MYYGYVYGNNNKRLMLNNKPYQMMEDYEKNLFFRPTPRYDFAYLNRGLYLPRLGAQPPPPPPLPPPYLDTILAPATPVLTTPIGFRTYFKPPVLVPMVRPTDIYPLKPLVPRHVRPNMANIRKSNSLFTKSSSHQHDGSCFVFSFFFSIYFFPSFF